MPGKGLRALVQATGNKKAPRASSPADRAEVNSPLSVRAPVSTQPSLLHMSEAPASPFSFAHPARCSSRPTPATSHQTVRRNRKTIAAWKTSSPAPSLSSAGDFPLPPAIEPPLDTTIRMSPHFHPTMAAALPIQSCRIHPFLHSGTAKILRLRRNAPAHPESPPHIRAREASRTCSIPLEHFLSRREFDTQG